MAVRSRSVADTCREPTDALLPTSPFPVPAVPVGTADWLRDAGLASTDQSEDVLAIVNWVVGAEPTSTVPCEDDPA
eukprot:CAMPEP_0181357592 /NCGR_PEP_ID=MMETSP1106-20121128/5048_1 /TAXON_ID=81844 /ORGANISM="Mantoniella antarctica, Strain SL-175" /LENGTH=75 /DNA_ID=CAMNT_0023470475 /DNA_START=2029 /DNA_END=2252 /DNA_ORIENTATION=-